MCILTALIRLRKATNIRIGSAASLPEIPKCNPHITISAFAIALAEAIVFDKWNSNFLRPTIELPFYKELEIAQSDLSCNGGDFLIKRNKLIMHITYKKITKKVM